MAVGIVILGEKYIGGMVHRRRREKKKKTFA
jgi:hypothetical protein